MGAPQQALDAEAAADKALEAMMNNRGEQPPVAVTDPDLDAQATPNAEKPEAVREPVAAEKPVVVEGDIDELASLRAEMVREQALRRTLEGRLKSQLKPAHEEIRQLRRELAEQQEAVKKAIEESKKPGAQRFLSEDEARELGDVIDVNERMVKGVIEESLETGAIAQMVEKLVQQSKAAQAVASGPSEDFWPLVDQYQPGARELNRSRDAGWIDYLDEYDRRTGIQNRDLAEEALSGDDPIALADIFADYFGRQNGTVDTTEAAPVAARRVMPERAPNGAPVIRKSAAKSEESFTQREVQAFYDDLVRGKFKGKQAEADRIENQIMEAAQAGRIT